MPNSRDNDLLPVGHLTPVYPSVNYFKYFFIKVHKMLELFEKHVEEYCLMVFYTILNGRQCY
jgi:hypothetical protein